MNQSDWATMERYGLSKPNLERRCLRRESSAQCRLRMRQQKKMDQGELTLQRESQKTKGKAQKSKVPNPKSQLPTPSTEAEACFLKAIEIARKQQAKSLELRATVSLARLWQQQGKHHAARTTLSEIYNWFTEGFDTKDLQEAKSLLEELMESRLEVTD